MKRKIFLLAAALLLLLAGCQAESLPESSLSPSSSPSQTAAVSSPLPEITAQPSAEPSPSSDPLEQLLAQQPVDDNHDAFLVPTGGRMGTLLVTVEKGEQDPESELGGYDTVFSVWNPQDMETPIQTMTVPVEEMVFGHHEVVDANFDGCVDFGCQWFQGNQPTYWYFWIWDEEVGQFVEEPAFREISSPSFDPETETVKGWARYSGGGDGLTTFHRWEDGELVCVRRIETGYDTENRAYRDDEDTSVFASWIRVEDRIDGELTEVYYQYYAPDEENGGFFPEQEKWENLDYHGED